MRNIFILIAALGLAACGSGTNTASAPEPPREQAYRTLATYNSVVTTNFHVLGEARGVGPLCSSYACESREPLPTIGGLLGVEAPYTGRALADGSWEPQGETGGLEVWEITNPNGQTDYGAWLDHSFFVAGTAKVDEHTVAVGRTYGRMYPDAALPVEGTASYDGAMVGKDVISAADYAGAANLEVDFAAGSLDATFSDITDIATGERIADIAFTGVELTLDTRAAAAFDLPSAKGTDTYFNAHFYGPDNEEITGVFGKDTLIGAFGTKRQ